MSTRAQQRPRFIQRIPPLPPDRNALTRRTPGTRRTALARRIRRRGGTTHTRCRRNTDRGRPPTHPPTDPAPVQMAALELPMVVDGDDNIVILRPSSRFRLVVAKIPELQSHSCVHNKYACSPEEKGRRAEDPILTVGALWIYPASSLAWRVVEPRTGVGEERGGVEEVSEESCGKERGRESGGGFADLVHVELGQTRAKVEECGHPGEDFASSLGSGGGGCDGVVGDGAGVVWGGCEGAHGLCDG